jgi:hypothetical protein
VLGVAFSFGVPMAFAAVLGGAEASLAAVNAAVPPHAWALLLGIGALAGHLAGTSIDFFYFSTTMYTTLGIGDIWATGPIRIVAGIESLTGLVLITWTASFSYLAMERFWGGK